MDVGTPIFYNQRDSGCPPEAVTIGAPVEIVFEDHHIEEGFTLPKARLA